MYMSRIKMHLFEGKATVMTYSGATWVPVGNKWFSYGLADYLDFVIDSTDHLYVTYSDAPNGRKATVMTYNGATWESVGGVWFSPGWAFGPTLAVDNEDNLYIAYPDSANADKAMVMMYNGTSREFVGVSWFSEGYAYNPTIAIDNLGVLYVAYNDDFYDYKTTVMKYFNTGPVPVIPCWDSIIESPETCDDGNQISGDGCSSACQREAQSDVCVTDLGMTTLFQNHMLRKWFSATTVWYQWKRFAFCSPALVSEINHRMWVGGSAAAKSANILEVHI
jgi:cysteine-rich repeat protein